MIKKEENRLLILLSNMRLSSSDRNEITTIIKSTENLDWKYIVKMSVVQGINGIINYHIKTLPNIFPRHIVLQYKFFNEEIKALEDKQYKQYKSIYFDFVKNGICPVILKGFALSKYFYKKPGIRASKDLDILIPTDSLQNAKKILIKHGYIEKCDIQSPKLNVKDTLTGCYNKDSIYNTSAHGNAKYIKEDEQSYIELHHTDYYFGGLNLKYSYTNKEVGEDGLYYLDLVDMFIFSCAHFWQHHRGKMDTAALSLRCYSDVQEMYNIVLGKVGIEQLVRRIELYDIMELVKYVLTAVKMLLNADFDKKLLTDSDDVCYKGRNFAINVLEPKYLFDKELLADDLKDAYLCSEFSKKSNNVIDASFDQMEHTLNYTPQNMVYFSSDKPSENLFFNSHISSQFSFKVPLTKIGFDFKWNEKNLSLFLRYFGNHKYSSDNFNIHFASSYLKLKLFDKENIKIFYIQPNIHNSGNLFRLDVESNKMLISEGEMNFVIKKTYFDCVICIPWEELQFSPQIYQQFRFDIIGCFFENNDLKQQYEMNFSEGNGYQGKHNFANKYIKLTKG